MYEWYLSMEVKGANHSRGPCVQPPSLLLIQTDYIYPELLYKGLLLSDIATTGFPGEIGPKIPLTAARRRFSF